MVEIHSVTLRKETYGFAVSGAGRILYQVRNLDCCYLVFPNNVDMYLDMLIHDQPEYILGLGSCSDIDQRLIGIETICSNQYKGLLVAGDAYQKVAIKPFLEPNSQMAYVSTIESSYANVVSWKIMQLIKQQTLKSRYTFLTIPRTIKPWIASKCIDEVLKYRL